ncbi:unnamed protein product [Linum tenue]|uniref:DUF4283 domain-containing protein n=1 Tax=Linum tenue TaxID=586396 RepID=A0AAV0GMU7_9ROSI|nr:unnamed protein product [Linum tenue]
MRFHPHSFWARLLDIPIHYFHPVAVMKIGSRIGKPVRVDQATSTGARSDYARVCVQVDIKNPLLSKFTINGKKYFIQYEGLEKICLQCGTYFDRARCYCTANMETEEHNTEPEVLTPTEPHSGQDKDATYGGSRYRVLDVEEPKGTPSAPTQTTRGPSDTTANEMRQGNEQTQQPKKDKALGEQSKRGKQGVPDPARPDKTLGVVSSRKADHLRREGTALVHATAPLTCGSTMHVHERRDETTVKGVSFNDGDATTSDPGHLTRPPDPSGASIQDRIPPASPHVNTTSDPTVILQENPSMGDTPA